VSDIKTVVAGDVNQGDGVGVELYFNNMLTIENLQNIKL